MSSAFSELPQRCLSYTAEGSWRMESQAGIVANNLDIEMADSTAVAARMGYYDEETDLAASMG